MLNRLLKLFRARRPNPRLRGGRAVTDQLEPRTLLASIVSTTKLTYQDRDGDNVTVTLSKPILTSQAVANSIFTFDGGGGVSGSNAIPGHLLSINLTGIAAAAGTTITTVAVRSATNGGDGFAAVGQINATGLDLGNVTIDGDLGRILAGDATTTTPGLGALKVQSLGRYGTRSGSPDLNSVIQGPLASLTTKTDVKDASIDVQGGTNCKIGFITIGGSLIGGAVNFSGKITASGDIGAVAITGDMIGGSGAVSGNIISNGGKLASVTIGGSLIGGSGINCGVVYSELDMGAVTIKNNVVGKGDGSANVHSGGKLASVTIGGSLIGSIGVYSGWITSGSDMGAVKIAGNVTGGVGIHSGAISASRIASVAIGRSLIGGLGESSGFVTSGHDIGAVTINGDVAGGAGENSGLVQAFGKLASVTIGGSVMGGTAIHSGSIQSLLELTTLTIQGSLVGGSVSGVDTLFRSGVVEADRISTITIGGSIVSGTDDTTGAFGANGAILVKNDIGTLTIKGSIIGNSTNPALITARGQAATVGTTDLAIGKLTVNGRVEYGRIVAGDGLWTGSANNADAQIGQVVVGHDWISSDLVAGAAAGINGFFGNGDDTKIGANGGLGVRDVANVFSKITSIVIGGQVIGTANIGDHFGFVAENIGSFKVKGGTTTYTQLSGNGNDDILLSLFDYDVRLNEI